MPEIHASRTDVSVALNSINFNLHGGDQDTMHDATHDKF